MYFLANISIQRVCSFFGWKNGPRWHLLQKSVKTNRILLTKVASWLIVSLDCVNIQRKCGNFGNSTPRACFKVPYAIGYCFRDTWFAWSIACWFAMCLSSVDKYALQGLIMVAIFGRLGACKDEVASRKWNVFSFVLMGMLRTSCCWISCDGARFFNHSKSESWFQQDGQVTPKHFLSRKL